MDDGDSCTTTACTWCHWTVELNMVKLLCFDNVTCNHSCSVAQSCPTLCNPMDCSTPGFPVLHHLPEFAQTHAHWVSDAIQPSHPVTPFSCPQSFPASGSFPMSWFFASGSQSIGAAASASVLPMYIQGCFLLGLTGLISLQSKGVSQESSPAPQFINMNSLVLSLLYRP